MIHEEKCYMATCDNCGEVFNNGEYSMFPLASDVIDRIRNDSEWYSGDTDPDHKGKHYCTDCFKWHPEIDDKIILDESRKRPNSEQGVQVSDTTRAQSKEEPLSPNQPTVSVNQELLEKLKGLVVAIGLPMYATTIDFEYPEKTYDKSYGGGDCSKHGRYYGICHSCNRDFERAKKEADREASWKREKAISNATSLAKEAITKAETL